MKNMTSTCAPRTRIVGLRMLMSVTLISLAVIFGLSSYYGISYAERRFAIQQFDSVTATAIIETEESFDNFNLVYNTVASMYSNYFPDESEWPFVTLPDFYDTVQNLVEAYGTTVGFLPLVEPEPGADPNNQTVYEEFLFNYYANEPFLPKQPPPGVPIPGFGYGGIWGGIGTTGFGTIYHDVTGVVPWGSPFTTLMPMAQAVSQPATNTFLYAVNYHSTPEAGPDLDLVINCTSTMDNASQALSECTRMLPWTYDSFRDTMSAHLTYPIMLQQNSSKLVGFIVGQFDMLQLLSRVVPAYQGDVDAVITGAGYDETHTLVDDLTFTFTIVDGVPSFTGYGDLHDKTYSAFGRKNKDIGLFNSLIDIDFYPRQSFIAEYQTMTPVYGAIGSVMLILFCSLIFFIYDYTVSRESSEQQTVLQTKRRFVRFISHEVRTPLNTVTLGMKLFELELLKMKEAMLCMPLADFREEISNSLVNWMQLMYDVVGNSEAAVDVLSDLLNYDKIESGTLHLEFSMVPIFKVVAGVHKAFGLQAKQKSIDLKLVGALWDKDTPPADLQHLQRLGVVGDATRIAQVLRNLLLNALKFTPEHGTVQILAEWDADGLSGDSASIDVPADQLKDTEPLLQQPRAGAIRISVTDSGAGLSEQQLAQICNEGVQFNANQLQAGQGSGLGLFISKGIVEQHGGRMDVTSKGLGLGTTFTTALPLFAGFEAMNIYETSEHSVGISKSNAEPVPETGAGDRRRRILVVDDALSNRKLLCRILHTRGYEAEDGAKALTRYQDMCSRGEPPDAILSDYEMPVMNGPDAVAKMRQLGCECFIMGITGNVMQSDIDYFKAHGADSVLAKPLNTDTFESLFKLHLQQQQQKQQQGQFTSLARVPPQPGKNAGQAPESMRKNAENHALADSNKILPYDEEEETA